MNDSDTPESVRGGLGRIAPETASSSEPRRTSVPTIPRAGGQSPAPAGASRPHLIAGATDSELRGETRSADTRSPDLRAPEAKAPEARSIAFDRRELDAILRLYGRMVAAGEWRDYAIDFRREEAVFSVYRRTSEMPLYRIVKTPKLARKQGAYSVVAPGGMILKRGPDLARVLAVLEPKRDLRVVV